MPQNSFRIAITLALIAPAFMTGAGAQINKAAHGPAPAARVAPPAPHIAAPPPHIAAPAATPHVAVMPHPSAPVQIAAPRGPSPQVARPSFARSNVPRPNIALPNIARPNGVTALARHNAGPSGRPQLDRRLSRHSPPPADVRQQARDNAATPGPRNAGRQATPLTPSTVGLGSADPNRNAARGAAQSQIYAQGRRPVLHNQSFANLAARDPATRALAHTTFQGGFAQFRSHDHDRDRDRFRGRVIGWIGPVFWPYADADLIDYAYWPNADDTFWPYAYDDVYVGMFGPYALEQSASVGAPAAGVSAPRGSAVGGFAQICSGQTAGLTDFPIERIAQQVQPDDAQRAALDRLKSATAQALDSLNSACPTDLPSTPTGRLAAMRQRTEAMLQAVRIVRPALDKFYDALSDEQKERFNALEPASAAAAPQPGLAQVCGGQAMPASLPLDRIEQTLRPDDRQRAALRQLEDATNKAAALLRANCPQGQTLTPTGRVAAMEQRLDAMLQAIDTVQPALTKFYGSLSDEQKARFDRLRPRAT